MFIIYRQETSDGMLQVMAVLETSEAEAQEEVESLITSEHMPHHPHNVDRRHFLLDTRTKELTSFLTMKERLEAAKP